MFFAYQNNERSSLAQTELSSSRDRRWSLGGTTYHFGKSHLGSLPAPQRLIHLKPPEPTIFGGMKMLSYDFHGRAALCIFPFPFDQQLLELYLYEMCPLGARLSSTRFFR